MTIGKTRGGSTWRSRTGALGLGLAVAASALAVAPTTPSSAAPVAEPSARLTADDDLTADEALALAAGTGSNVEVPEWTTETNQVFARPDGKFELSAHRETVRTDINGDWEPIDTTLELNSDGNYSPAAISIPLEFDDGGGTKIVTAGEGDDAISFAWNDGSLPEAEVSGNQLTYPEVRPGVDLVFTAHADGYSDALIVKTKAAAEALAEDPATFTGTSSGLDMSITPDGSFVGTNPDTGAAFIGPPPIAWDSTDATNGEAPPDAISSGTGTVHELPLPVIEEPDADQGSEVTLEVSPPAEALADPDTTYPLYLDPQVAGRSREHYLTVHQYGWNYHDVATQPMRVGYCGWYPECNNNTQGNARSYFTFNISALTSVTTAEPVLFDVRVAAEQVWSATSTAQPVVLRKSGDFDLTDNWPGPAGDNLQSISSNGGRNGENPEWLKFDNEALRQYVFNVGSILNQSTVYFALSAPVNNDKNLWKKFNNDVRMTIVFGYPPKITSYTSTDTVACPGKPVYSRGKVTLKQTADEVTVGNYGLRYRFQIFQDTNNLAGPWTTAVRDSGPAWNTTNPYSPLPTLPSGKYAWRAGASTVVGVNDPNGDPYPNVETWTNPALRPFTVDTTKPAAPKITSDDFPKSYWGASAANGGTFTVDTLPTDAAGIAYAFNNDAPDLFDTRCTYADGGFKARTSGPIVLTAPANTLLAGVRNTLNVYTFDDAHNITEADTYEFYVSPNLTANVATTNRIDVEGATVAKIANDPVAVSFSADDPAPGLGKVLSITSTDSQAYADLTFTVPHAGYYALGAKFINCSTCGTAQISVPTAETGHKEVNTATAVPSSYVLLGGYSFRPPEGDPDGPIRATVKVQVTTGSPEPSSTVKIDYLTLVQLHADAYGTSDQIDVNLAAAFNNRGIGNPGEADVVLDPPILANPVLGISAEPSGGLSKADLTALTIIPGETFQVPDPNGGPPLPIKFKIPTATASGDNVIASGQTIAMPADTKAHHVDLLVAATCGTVQATQSALFDLVHQPPPPAPGAPLPPTVTTNPQLPGLVPEWRDTATTAEITPIAMPKHLTNSPAVLTTGQARLYAMTIDVDDQQTANPLIGVTLPSTGASLTQDCNGAPRLHVLAIATRP